MPKFGSSYGNGNGGVGAPRLPNSKGSTKGNNAGGKEQKAKVSKGGANFSGQG